MVYYIFSVFTQRKSLWTCLDLTSHGCCIPRLVGCVSINFDSMTSMNKKWRCQFVRSCLFALASLFSYCWWKQSCTTWNVWNPLNTGINYQPQLVSLFVLFGPFRRLVQRSYLVPCMVRGLNRLWSTNKWSKQWILAMGDNSTSHSGRHF